MKNEEILNDKLNFRHFISAMGFYSFHDYIPNSYTNEDMMIYLYPGKKILRIEHCYEEPYRTIKTSMPKTVKEAIEVYQIIHFDLNFNESDIEDLLTDYLAEMGIRKITVAPQLMLPIKDRQ